METQKRQSIDLLNVLKYLMVLVFLAYIVFLVSRESADDVPVKTLQENVMKAGTEEGMTKGTGGSSGKRTAEDPENQL